MNINTIDDLYFNLTTELNLSNGVLNNDYHRVVEKNFNEEFYQIVMK